jgi:Uncharacterized protein conserved in bacteria
MRILLDTNALLWALTNGPRIDPVRKLLLDDGNEIFVSAVSWWEIAIKTRIGKLEVSMPEIRIAAQASGFLELPLLGSHAEMLATIPRYHNDPFDHMLLAQTMAEPMRLITGDSILPQYTPLVIYI